MKKEYTSIGSSLDTMYYSVYAQYFVRYLKSMESEGINIEAVTPQNEPHHGGNNPSMVMTSAEQADFIKNHLGPAFQVAGISTKIIIWDHNCDEPNYPIEVMNDPAAKAFVHGSAFHMYAGDASALSKVYDAHPDKALYFTEQWTGKNGTFDGDFQWHIKNVIIGTMRNWSRVALEWNLANDPDFGPHTPGGCTECKGAVTINGNLATKNVSYYIIGQVAKFVPPGSVRLTSNLTGPLPNVAFRRPDGKIVLLVLNESAESQSFNIQAGSRWILASLPAKTAGSFVW
jgi:glucosylceramidase